ncbi:MAG: glycosyltransferase 61 family protein [Hyphococcus sp.]
MHVRHLVERRLFGDVSFKDICDEHRIVNPAEPYDIGPAVFLKEQLDNVTGIGPETSKAAEHERLHGGSGVHAPIEAFHIRGAKFRDSGLYKRNWRFYFPHVPPASPAAPVRVDGGTYALSSSYSGIQYFGHWLRDDMTTKLLAEQFAQPFCVRIPDWPDPKYYLGVLDASWPVVDWANLDEIIFFLDFSQNTNKVARYRDMRRRLRQNVTPTHTGHRVYLRRGDTGAIKRIISNETELSDALAREGFLIVDITRDPIETIVETLLDARIVVTIEGSQGDHALYTMADKAGFLAIMPPNMLNNTPKDWTSALGMQYGVVIGEADGEAFKVNPRDVLTIAERLDHAL